MARGYNNYNLEEIQTSGTRWNFDDAESILIFELKKEFVKCLLIWDLESAFWKYKALSMESRALFDEEERKKIDKSLESISKYRNEFNLIKQPRQDVKGEYYELLEAKYIEVCDILHKHGLYFREYEAEDDDEL